MLVSVYKIERGGKGEEGREDRQTEANRDTKTSFVAQGCLELIMLPRLAPPALDSGVL